MHIEGTWVGYYYRGAECYLAVDYYRQPIGGVSIEGRGYFLENKGNKLSANGNHWRDIVQIDLWLMNNQFPFKAWIRKVLHDDAGLFFPIVKS